MRILVPVGPKLIHHIACLGQLALLVLFAVAARYLHRLLAPAAALPHRVIGSTILFLGLLIVYGLLLSEAAQLHAYGALALATLNRDGLSSGRPLGNRHRITMLFIYDLCHLIYVLVYTKKTTEYRWQTTAFVAVYDGALFKRG